MVAELSVPSLSVLSEVAALLSAHRDAVKTAEHQAWRLPDETFLIGLLSVACGDTERRRRFKRSFFSAFRVNEADAASCVQRWWRSGRHSPRSTPAGVVAEVPSKEVAAAELSKPDHPTTQEVLMSVVVPEGHAAECAPAALAAPAADVRPAILEDLVPELASEASPQLGVTASRLGLELPTTQEVLIAAVAAPAVQQPTTQEVLLAAVSPDIPEEESAATALTRGSRTETEEALLNAMAQKSIGRHAPSTQEVLLSAVVGTPKSTLTGGDAAAQGGPATAGDILPAAPPPTTGLTTSSRPPTGSVMEQTRRPASHLQIDGGVAPVDDPEELPPVTVARSDEAAVARATAPSPVAPSMPPRPASAGSRAEPRPSSRGGAEASSISTPRARTPRGRPSPLSSLVEGGGPVSAVRALVAAQPLSARSSSSVGGGRPASGGGASASGASASVTPRSGSSAVGGSAAEDTKTRGVRGDNPYRRKWNPRLAAAERKAREEEAAAAQQAKVAAREASVAENNKHDAEPSFHEAGPPMELSPLLDPEARHVGAGHLDGAAHMPNEQRHGDAWSLPKSADPVIAEVDEYGAAGAGFSMAAPSGRGAPQRPSSREGVLGVAPPPGARAPPDTSDHRQGESAAGGVRRRMAEIRAAAERRAYNSGPGRDVDACTLDTGSPPDAHFNAEPCARGLDPPGGGEAPGSDRRQVSAIRAIAERRGREQRQAGGATPPLAPAAPQHASAALSAATATGAGGGLPPTGPLAPGAATRSLTPPRGAVYKPTKIYSGRNGVPGGLSEALGLRYGQPPPAAGAG